MRKSERLASVLQVALQGMSDPKAARHCMDRGYVISHNPINVARVRGEWGREETLRTLGMGIADLLFPHYGDEIEREAGSRTDRAAGEWLVSVAVGPDPAEDQRLEALATRIAEKVAARTLTYERLDPLEEAAFTGLRALPDSEREAKLRALLDDLRTEERGFP